MLLFAPCFGRACVLKEAWLWRRSEGRVGSYAFRANLLLLASPTITYPIPLTKFWYPCWTKQL